MNTCVGSVLVTLYEGKGERGRWGEFLLPCTA
jgi:hypothetical protein